jgi:hypothetical protein
MQLLLDTGGFQNHFCTDDNEIMKNKNKDTHITPLIAQNIAHGINLTTKDETEVHPQCDQTKGNQSTNDEHRCSSFRTCN